MVLWAWTALECRALRGPIMPSKLSKRESLPYRNEIGPVRTPALSQLVQEYEFSTHRAVDPKSRS